MRSLALLSMAFIVGCATPYQRDGFRGGLSHTQVAPNSFIVTFKGNAFTGRDAVGDYALLGAAELTQRAGYRFFTIMQANNADRPYRMVVPGSSDTQGQWVGNQYQSTTTTTPATSYDMNKPGVTLAVQCSNEGSPDAFDAAFLTNSIRAKYGIR